VSGKLGGWVLEYLSSYEGVAIVGVDTQTDRKGQEDCIPTILRLGLRLANYDAIVLEEPELFISIGYVKKVGRDLLDQCPCVNLHSGKLPEYRGRNTFAHSIENGDRFHYMTLTMMTEDWDAGGIIAEKRVRIGEDDTCLDLFWKAQFAGLELFKDEIGNILAGCCKEIPQRGEERYYTKELEKQVDMCWPDRRIYDFVRSRQFPPYEPAYMMVGGHKINLTI
jgi:methionyl-tRNA formyltransferase